MRLLVYARGELIDRTARVAPDAALLLEGCWPANAPRDVCRSLDELIDGRFAWIDQQAAELADSAVNHPDAAATLGPGNGPFGGISLGFLNALALRYYLLKLIRPLAYLTEVQPLPAGSYLELVAAAGRDEDYAEVFSQSCRASGVHLRIRWVRQAAGPGPRFPANGRWRRGIARLSNLLKRRPAPNNHGRRVVLCGDPRLLDPVCRELLARGCNLWWLADRFAIRRWLRWRAAGVGQLVCDSSLGRENLLAADLPGRMDCRGVDLAGPVRRWLSKRAATHGPRQTRMVEQIDAHLRQVRPQALVLDEDATPLARAAVAVGRRYGVGSLVVQHGVPYCRFGFTPPVADRILVWGRSSAERLIQWGVPPERIRVTGAPHARGLSGFSRRGLSRFSRSENGTVPFPSSLRRILLLTTIPPRDDRPDAVALHLTGETYAEMLRMAFAAVAGIEGAKLIVKLHPRSSDDPAVRSLRAEFPRLDSRVVRRGRPQDWLSGVDCVLSCGSSAGVEATLAGVPVIELAPPRAVGFLPHEEWDLTGTAHSELELRELLARVAAGSRPARQGPNSDVFAALGRQAAARIAHEVMTPIDASPEAAAIETEAAGRAAADRQALPAGYC